MKRFRIILLAVVWLLAATVPAGAQTEFFIHTVRWYEGINDISKKYDVPVEVIMEVNGLEKPKVKSRMKLKIPVDLQAYYRTKAQTDKNTTDSSAVEAAKKAENTVVAQDVTEPEEEDNDKAESSWSWGSIFGFKNQVTATLVLPLGQDASSDNAFDFYSGAMLAARDLGEKGINADINVINLTGDEVSEDAAKKLGKADFIIGPVSEKDIQKVLAVAGKTPVISPLDPRAAGMADSIANFIHAPTAAYRQYVDIAQWLDQEREREDNIVLISETGTALSAGMKALVKELESRGVSFKKLEYSILEGRNVTNKVESAMVAEKTNRVVVLSEKEAFVNDVVRNLNLMLYNKFDVVLYSASKIRSYETIDIENLHSLNLHVCTSYYIDYDDPRVKDFVKTYRALFNAEPTQFSFQGYDVMGFFVKACHDSSKWYKKLARISRAKMLQADFKFERQHDGGYLNTGTRRIIYTPDYSVKEILH